jgi:hypothetical protein
MHPIELLAALTFTSETPDRYHAIEHHFAVRHERRLARLERRRRRRPVRLPWLQDRRGGHTPTLRARIDPA